MKTIIGLILITLGLSIVAASTLLYLSNQDTSYLQKYGAISSGVILLGVLVTKSGFLDEEVSMTTARLEFFKLLRDGVAEDKAIKQIVDRFPYSEETVIEWNNAFQRLREEIAEKN